MFALMLEDDSLFGWGLVSKQIQETLRFFSNSFMPMCLDMIRLESCHALDLDFTCNLVVALEDLTEIFATALIPIC